MFRLSGLRWHLRTILWVGFVGLPQASVGATLALPSQTDLHAAYCLSVVRFQIVFLDVGLKSLSRTGATKARKLQGAMDRQLATAAGRLEDLQRYLDPRLPYLEPVGMATAYSQGDADVGHLLASMNSTCDVLCGHASAPSQCVAACTPSDIRRRIRSCKVLGWLPY